MRAALCSQGRERSSVMQTLRFYTRRVFGLDVSVPRPADFLSSGPEIPNDYRARQDWRGFHARTHNFDANALRRPPGEQLPFQPQPPPVSNSGPVKYTDLNIGRNIDQELGA
uniref:Uncharacterized protein n=1 Tax=Globodera rostochiensis TaxID=31243 RepID=A0A914HW61_GLORO